MDEARAWLAVDPDADTRAELEELVAAAGAGDAAPLAARFAGRLQFGTAGLRGELGAGPMRMNRVTVRRATAGLVRYLLATRARRRPAGHRHRLRRPPQERRVRPGRRRGGRRARHASDTDARARADARCWRGRSPPRGRGRGDGHRQPQPAPGQRVQGVPGRRVPDRLAGRRRDRGRASTPSTCRDRARRRRRPADRPPGRRRRSRPISTPCPGCASCRSSTMSRSRTRRCTAWAGTRCWPPSSGRVGPARPSWPPSSSPTPTSRPCPSPTRRNRAPWTC